MLTAETLTLEDGKYALVLHPDGKFEALRYGQPWRDLCGDKMVLCLMQRIQALESQVEDLRHEITYANSR